MFGYFIYLIMLMNAKIFDNIKHQLNDVSGQSVDIIILDNITLR